MYTVLSNTTFQINDLVTNLSPSRKRPSSYYCLLNSRTPRTPRNGQSLKVSNICEKSSRETGPGKESKPTSPNQTNLVTQQPHKLGSLTHHPPVTGNSCYVSLLISPPIVSVSALAHLRLFAFCLLNSDAAGSIRLIKRLPHESSTVRS